MKATRLFITHESKRRLGARNALVEFLLKICLKISLISKLIRQNRRNKQNKHLNFSSGMSSLEIINKKLLGINSFYYDTWKFKSIYTTSTNPQQKRDFTICITKEPVTVIYLVKQVYLMQAKYNGMI